MKTLPILTSVLLTFFATAASAVYSPKSAYTSLKFEDCITVNSTDFLPESEQDVDFYAGVCPGFGGYSLMVSGGDLRYSLLLSFNGKNIPLPFLAQFHETGAVAEWRYTLTKTVVDFSNDLELKALIYRLNYSDMDRNGKNINKSMLVVVRLNKEKSCVIGKIPQQKDMNVVARKLADNPSAKCIGL